MWDQLDRVLQEIESRGLKMILVEGGARGADRLGREWGWHNNVHVITERAKWTVYGNGAGAVRNQEMIDKHKPDALLAMPGGKGTADMVRRCLDAAIPVIMFAR
jgi:hypothetical protein